MSLIEALGLQPTERLRRGAMATATAAPRAASSSTTTRTASAAALAPAAGQTSGGGSVAGGIDVEAVTREFGPLRTRYGEFKVGATLKIQKMAKGGEGDEVSFGGAVTSKNKPDARVLGTKKTFSFGAIADRELFAGLTLADLSVGFEPEISGLDITVSGLVKFTVVTNAFKAPAQAKLTLLNIKGGSEVHGPALEIKVAPVSFSYKLDGIDTKILVELKASFTVYTAEFAKKALELAARKLLEKEAKKRGVKVLERKLAESLLKDLGPIAAAFGVGLDIGALLNEFTVAPKAAKYVIDDILGDLPERYHEKDTLGKMWLISKNSPRILAALVAGGVIGTAAGVADVVLFKLLGLDKLKDFGPAFEAFSQGLTDMLEVTNAPLQIGANAIFARALVIGIKFNPKHANAHHGALVPVIAAIFAKIQPLYRSGSPSDVISMQLKAVNLDAARFLKFATFAHGWKMQLDGQVDLSSPETVADSLRNLVLGDFLRFLENNRMLSCDVSLGNSLDPDDIDPKLIDELTQ